MLVFTCSAAALKELISLSSREVLLPLGRFAVHNRCQKFVRVLVGVLGHGERQTGVNAAFRATSGWVFSPIGGDWDGMIVVRKMMISKGGGVGRKTTEKMRKKMMMMMMMMMMMKMRMRMKMRMKMMMKMRMMMMKMRMKMMMMMMKMRLKMRMKMMMMKMRMMMMKMRIKMMMMKMRLKMRMRMKGAVGE